MKRSFDLIAAIVLLVLLSPLLIILSILVRLTLGSPVIFRQPRPGQDGRLFNCLKFRTMTDSRDDNEQLLPDENRLTMIGRFLRNFSLDELPELINVVAGDMSLVGPRPLLAAYIPRYSTTQMRRHEVRPGITGWAQINGRNALDWNEKFEMDVWYVDHQSFRLDMWILAKTVWQVLRQKGITKPGHATMPEFIGVAKQNHIS